MGAQGIFTHSNSAAYSSLYAVPFPGMIARTFKFNWGATLSLATPFFGSALGGRQQSCGAASLALTCASPISIALLQKRVRHLQSINITDPRLAATVKENFTSLSDQRSSNINDYCPKR